MAGGCWSAFWVSHAPLVEGVGAGEYTKPLTRMREHPRRPRRSSASAGVVEDRALGRTRPKYARNSARHRSAGAHPDLVTPENTRIVRDALGPDRLVAPEQAVVLSTDPPETGRSHGSTWRSTSICRTTRTTGGVWATASRTFRTAAATTRRRPRRVGRRSDDPASCPRTTAVPKRHDVRVQKPQRRSDGPPTYEARC